MSIRKGEDELRSVRFFKELPNELTYQIFSELTVADLAAIAQVSDAGTRIASEPNLALFQYKFENKACLLDQDIAVILRENDPPLYSELRIISKAQKLKIEISIKPENVENIAAAIKEGKLAVIAALRELSLEPITEFLNSYTPQFSAIP